MKGQESRYMKVEEERQGRRSGKEEQKGADV